VRNVLRLCIPKSRIHDSLNSRERPSSLMGNRFEEGAMIMVQKEQRRLGRGLSTIVSSTVGQIDQGGAASGLRGLEVPEAVHEPKRSAKLMTIDVDRIRDNPCQPRKRFDEAGIASLAASIRQHGTLQPIVVRPAVDGFELVAGERRLRAAKVAGIRELPAIVRTANDEQLLELALVENIQREDLNPVERAKAYRSLHLQHGLSHEEIADRVGEDRSTVANYIRLLALPDEALGLLEDGSMTTGHAKAILTIADIGRQRLVISQIIRQGWSVRRLEQEVAALRGRPECDRPKRELRPAVKELQQRLAEATGLKVSIKEGRRRHTGRIIIEYNSLDDFQRMVDRLGAEEEIV